MKIPTYFKESNYKIVEVEEDLLSIRIVNEVEKDKYNEFFEIYYFGELDSDAIITEIFDEKTSTIKPCKVVAKCIQTGKEILLYDQLKYGYNSLFCDKFDLETFDNRPLVKLDIPNSKIEIDLGYSIDYDEEKEDFEFDDNDYLETINGEKISFEDVKKDGFDYIKISAIDEDKVIREVLNLELA